MTERLHFHFSLSYIGEGNGNPLQCSCLENPREGGAWWAAVYRVAPSRTQLKRLSSSSSSSSSSVCMPPLLSHFGWDGFDNCQPLVFFMACAHMPGATMQIRVSLLLQFYLHPPKTPPRNSIPWPTPPPIPILHSSFFL